MKVIRSMIFRREGLLGLVAVLFLVGSLLIVYAFSPTYLRVAVSRDEPALKLLEAWSQSLQKARADFRLRVVPVAGHAEAAELLQRGKADLAVVRPDKVLPDNGMTVALLRVEAIVLAALPGRAIEGAAVLAGRRLGVIQGSPDTLALVDRVGRAIGWDPPPTIVPLRKEDIGDRDILGGVDAIMHVAPLAEREIRSVLGKLDETLGGPVGFLALEDAQALSERDPVFENVDLEAGALSPEPKRPDEKSSTLGISLRLMAHADLSRIAIYEVTRLLFEMRTRLARQNTLANGIRAPESSTSALLPIHPGTIDYIERDQQTFLSRYSDFIYIGASLLGGLISAIAAISQRFVRKRREKIDEILTRLTRVLRDARTAGSLGDLDQLTVEADEVVSQAVNAALHRTTDVRGMSALVLATDSVRRAIDDRRRMLGRR